MIIIYRNNSITVKQMFNINIEQVITYLYDYDFINFLLSTVK